MEFNTFVNPISMRNSMGPWKVEDLVSPIMERKQLNQHRHGKVDSTVQLGSSLGSSSRREEKGVPRIPGQCDMCLVDETPLWRSGPNGRKTLCNACGLRYSKELKKVALVLGEKAKASAGDVSSVSDGTKPKMPKNVNKSRTNRQP